MSKKLWIKSALILATGAVLQAGFGLNEGCFRTIVQRTIVGVLFD